MARRRTGRLLLAALLAVVVAVAVGPAAPAGAQEDAEPGRVDRLVVLSLPTLSPEELEGPHLPRLNELLADSAVAALSVRAVSRTTGPGDGYATVGAGTRARGAAGDALAFGPGDEYAGAPAATEFRLRTGTEPGSGLFSLGAPRVVDRNAGLRFDAEVGALAAALEEAGVARGVVANADGSVGGDDDDARYHREALLGLMGEDGLVPAGSVGESLLAADPGAPFGVRLDLDRVAAAVDEVGRAERSVVLVEASDLVREDRYRGLAGRRQRAVLRADALRRTDELVGRVLEQVDLRRDGVLVIGPHHARGRLHLTVAGVHAPGVEPGSLRSPSTRRSGFVTLVDVAPTVLDLVGVERPASMEGRPFEPVADDEDADGRVAAMAESDRAARFRDRMVGPASVVFVVLNLVLWVLAVAALSVPLRGSRWVVGLASLGLLAFLPATHLAGLLPLHRGGEGAFWLFLAGTSVAGGALALLIGRRQRLDPLLVVLAGIIGLLVVDVVLGAPLQLNTVYGYSPTIAGRFAGFGNLAFAQLASAGILLAGLLARRFGRPRGVAAGVAVLVVAVLADGLPMWGSDVGGVLTLVPAAAATVALLLGWRLRARGVLLGGVAAVAVLGLVALADLARPAEDRTHLGRLVERVGSDGVGAFETVVLRKLDANLAVLTRSVWTLMVPVVFTFAGYLLWRAPWRLRRIREGNPELRAAFVGLLVATVLGFALNDSGIAVPGVMLGVINASLVYLVARTT